MMAVATAPGVSVAKVTGRMNEIERVCLQDAGRLRLIVVGELDLASSQALELDLRRAKERNMDLLLDLSQVQFMDAHSARALTEAIADAREAGLRLDLAPELTPQVRRLFELLDLRDG